jgi:hypothetical protein
MTNPKKLVDGKSVALKGEELTDFLDRLENPPALPSPPAFTYKADIWRRCTETEADKLEAALAASPTRMRRIFESATRIEHGDDDFPALKAGVEAALGAKRAVEILAPSET